MNRLDIAGASMLDGTIDNPYAGSTQEDYINFQGKMFGKVEKFIIARNITKNGITIFGIGQLVKGRHIGQGNILVRINPKLENIFNKRFLKLRIGKDLTPSRSSGFGGINRNQLSGSYYGNVFSSADDSDLINFDLMGEEVSNLIATTSTLSATAPKTFATATPTATTTLAAPTTTLAAPTATLTSTPKPTAIVSETVAPISPTTALAPKPVLTATLAEPVTAAIPRPLSPEAIASQNNPPATTIIAPTTIQPEPYLVTPIAAALPTSNPAVMPMGGGGGSMGGGGGSMGGGGGAPAEKKAEATDAAKTADAKAVAAGAVVEEPKIFGMKKKTFWIATSVVAAAAIGLAIYKFRKKAA